MEGKRIASPTTTTRYGLREGVKGGGIGVDEKSMNNNFLSDDDEEFTLKWSFQPSSHNHPGSPEQINDSTSRIIHDATSPPLSHHGPEYGKINSHGPGLAVPLVTPPGLTKATDCRAQMKNQPTAKSTTPAATNNQNIDEVDDDGTFVGRNGRGGCGICLGLSETVDTTLSSMTDLFMDYIGGNNTIDSACTTKWKNVPGVATGFHYETAAQKQERLRTEKQYAWTRCFEDE